MKCWRNGNTDCHAVDSLTNKEERLLNPKDKPFVFFAGNVIPAGGPLSLISSRRIVGHFALGGVLMVPVSINRRQTYFLFDSGAATTGINKEFSEAFGIQIDPIRRTPLYIADKEPINAPIGVAEEFRIGGVVRKNLSVVIINFPHQSALRGLVGMNFLKGWRFTVEMDTGTLILREARKS